MTDHLNLIRIKLQHLSRTSLGICAAEGVDSVGLKASIRMADVHAPFYLCD